MFQRKALRKPCFSTRLEGLYKIMCLAIKAYKVSSLNTPADKPAREFMRCKSGGVRPSCPSPRYINALCNNHLSS